MQKQQYLQWCWSLVCKHINIYNDVGAWHSFSCLASERQLTRLSIDVVGCLSQALEPPPSLPYACSPGIDTHSKAGLAKTILFTMMFEAWYVKTTVFTMILKRGMQQL